jgi:16S rRNA (cytosine1402-N4)-methyltransferase
MANQTTYHDAVMLKESTEALDIKPDGIYVDVTYGGGGHSKEILKNLTTGKLYAFDQDPDSEKEKTTSDNLIFINQNFRYLTNYLRMYQALPIDGLLADLGISSHQIDTDGRGFAFRSDGPLDMRMSQQGELTAAKVVNEYSEQALTEMFSQYGELKNSRQVARKIVEARTENPFTSTSQLASCVEKLFPARFKHKFLSQVFQAIRIEVNGELEALKELLSQCGETIKENGRIAFITYHSLEDRLVKNYIKSGNFKGELKKDFYGNVIKPFEAVNRKPLLPSEEELLRNNRSRSAKLRVAVKLKKVE